ncbi:hypothetical protein F4808DRAFT_473402 [Astrocystis sublimbata]|nr:hypothetical protein F4808DRAFT_473402 [Astrocystis sublimbata]
MTSPLAPFQEYLGEKKSTTKLTPREHPDYEVLQACFTRKPALQPVLIARPQNTEDVQILVQYCMQKDIKFGVCTGVDDSPSGTLQIDMRDIDHVDVADDRTTAKVGGGIFFRGIAKALREKELVVPAATVAKVGYVGWTTLSGYGSISALQGLGVDQIISAKIVNFKGEVVQASDDLLKSIIGDGGVYGVIVELTIQVYSLSQIISPASLDVSSEFENP